VGLAHGHRRRRGCGPHRRRAARPVRLLSGPLFSGVRADRRTAKINSGTGCKDRMPRKAAMPTPAAAKAD
jgi:hypothetical protein